MSKKQNKLWAEIINDSRFYDGTPQGLQRMTNHFNNKFLLIEMDKDNLPTDKEILNESIERSSIEAGIVTKIAEHYHEMGAKWMRSKVFKILGIK